jgi:serine protease Do
MAVVQTVRTMSAGPNASQRVVRSDLLTVIVTRRRREMNISLKGLRVLLLLLPLAGMIVACDPAPAAPPTSVPASPTPTPTATSTTTATATATSVPTATPQPPSPTPTMTWDGVAKALKPSVVYVEGSWPKTFLNTEGIGWGTGIVLDTQHGYIATAAHVVEGANSIKVYDAGSIKPRSVTIVGISMCDDLAILKVDDTEGLKAAKLGDSKATELGEDVAAIGYAALPGSNLDPSLSIGTIGKKEVYFAPYGNLFQMTVQLSPGDSGGPLVNQRGEVIGINVLTTEKGNFGYAIPISYAKPLLEELQAGKSERYSGLNFYFLGNDFKEYFGTDAGIVVDAVGVGSPAYDAGVRGGDLLLEINGSKVNSLGDVCDIFSSHSDGDQLHLTVLRVDPTTRFTETCEGNMTIGTSGGAGKLNCVPVLTPGIQPKCAEIPGFEGYTRVLCDDFSNNNPGYWPVGSYDYGAVTVSGGIYSIHIQGANIYPVAMVPNFSGTDHMADGLVIADVQAQGDGVAGVLARGTVNGDFYDCWIDNAQRSGCFKWVDGKHIPITQTVHRSEIVPQRYNRLALVMIGTTLYFYINGEQVVKVDDNTLASGSWGVFASTGEGNNTFTANYDLVFIDRANQ